VLFFRFHATREVAMTHGSIAVATELCKGCELCVAACPQECIAVSTAFNARGYRFAELRPPDTCTGCAACAVVCPDAAITVLRESRKHRAA
jgi:2-oxoglutarate ferredoxin oxidoreductase subunit delta